MQRASADPRVAVEQTRLLYRGAAQGIVATLINALVLAFLLRTSIPTTHLMAWIAAAYVVSAVRAIDIFSFARRASDSLSVHAKTRFVIGLFVSGVVWGSASFVIFPSDSIAHQSLLGLFLGGMVAGAAATFAVSFKAFLSFSIPALVPFVARVGAFGDEMHLGMAFVALFFLGLLTVGTLRTRAALVRGLRLRFEKEDLAETLRQAKDDAERLNRQLATEHTLRLESLGVLAGGIAHDFNNLLTAILGSLELVDRERIPDAALSERLSDARKAIAQALRLTEQLLTFSTGGEPRLAAVSLSDLLDECIGFLGADASDSIDVHLEDELWPVSADAGQLSQVMHNLLLNSLQASDRGDPVHVSASNHRAEEANPESLPAGRYVRIKVMDRGVGIAPDVQARAFEPYFTTKQSGMGLGLATCRSIVLRHGGRISLRSDVGRGTQITLFIPAADAPLRRERASNRAPRPPRGTRVLLMDDDEKVRRTVRVLLEMLGCQVTESSDGESAVSAYEAALADGAPFDVTILDLTVTRGMGGVATAEAIHRCDSEARLIVSSGYSNDSAIASYDKLGFCAVLPKPYTFEELERVLRQAVRITPAENRARTSR